MTGSGLAERHFAKLDARLTNVAERNILGEGRSARLMILRASAGVQSARNLFLLSCAFNIDRGRRAHNSSFKVSLLERLAALYQVTDWRVNTVEMEGFTNMGRGVGLVGIREFDAPEKWYLALLGVPPVEPRGYAALGFPTLM